MNINEEARKDPEQLEREVDERRAHMSDTLNALEQKLSPGHLFDQVVEYTRANGGEFSQNLVNTVKNNPVPTLLTAVGLTWLFYGQNASPRQQVDSRSGTTSNYNRETAYSSSGTSQTNIGAEAGEFKNSITNSLAGAKHSAADRAHKLGEQAHQAANSLRHSGERARAGFTQLLDEQPLALGAIGIAIGALLGGSLPATAKEDQLMGEYRDTLADKASSSAREAYDKASEVGRDMASDVKRDLSTDERPSYQ